MKKMLIVMLVMAVAGMAQANVINGDFATGDLTGWWATGAYTQVNWAPSYDTTGEGYVAQIGDGPANGILQMTSAVVEHAGQQFLLTADVGRIDYAPWHDFAVTMGGQVTTWPGPVYNTLEYVTYGPEDLTLGVPTHVEVLITATAATVGFNVFVEFYGNQYGYVDNIQLTAFKTAGNPIPDNGATRVPLDQVLSWTAPIDPNIVSVASYDVYLDPNLADVTAGDLSVKTNEAGTSHTPAANLEYDTTYYWRVDSNVDYDYIPGTDPNTEVGGIWSFTTVTPAPLITSGDNVLTSMEFLDATISATVTDADGDLLGVLWELLDEDILSLKGIVASLTDDTTDLYNPMASFTTDSNGIYQVRLTVTDAQSASDSRIFEVRVEETTCDQAKLGFTTAWAPNYYDRDSDCDVDLIDFAVFAVEWLDSTASDSQETWTGAIAYIPRVNGIPNGNFELGNLNYWGSDGWGAASITDVDVYEGSYAATFNPGGGVMTGALYLPVGSHSITLWYKGDLTKLICFPYLVGLPTPATLAITNLAPDGWWFDLFTGAATSYTQCTIQFDVTVAGMAWFEVWSVDDGVGNALVDDFRLVYNSH